MSFSAIEVKTHEFVTTITLNRPERLNALTLPMADELFSALHAHDKDDATRVFIITGAGPIGIMAAMVADHCGARNVILTDVNEYRLDLAKRIVPKVQPINVAKQEITRNFMESLGILEGFDVCLEMSGSPAAFRDVLSKMINGGNIAMLGIMPDDTGIDWTDVVFKGLNIKGIYGREMYETWYKMVMMIQSGLPIERIITHRFQYSEFQEGFDIMRSGQSGKVILDWKD